MFKKTMNKSSKTLFCSLLNRVFDIFHVGQNDISVAALQVQHKVQVVAELEAPDWLFLQI